MKRILLSAVLLSSIGVYAQKAPEVKKSNAVGIETTEPRATLDVKGDLRVQEVKEMESPESTEILFPDCKPCVLLIDQYGVVRREPKSKFLGGKSQSDSSGSTSGGSGGPGGGGPETPPDPEDGHTDPTVVGGTATFTTLSNVEKDIVSFKYGEQANEKIQGQVTSTVIPVKIPYTGATAGSVEEKIIAVEGKPNLKLKIKATEISDGNGELDAEIYYTGNGNYNLPLVTLQQVNEGNYKQATDVTFNVKVNGVTNPITVKVNALGGILGKKYHEGHKYLYIPVEGPDGNTWLTQNLGSEYANVDSEHFNPTKVGGDNPTDSNAYGDFYQWQRGTDGHQNVNSATIQETADSWVADNGGKFIIGKFSWNTRSSSGPYNKWTTESINNPCPTGYRVPTRSEWEKVTKPWRTALGLSLAGDRLYSDGTLEMRGIGGRYWSSSDGHNGYEAYAFYLSSDNWGTMNRRPMAHGFSVRCLRDKK